MFLSYLTDIYFPTAVQVGTLHCTEWFHSRNGYSVPNGSGSWGPVNPWMWVYAVVRPADEIIDLPPVEKSAVYWFLQHIWRHLALILASYPVQYLANFRNKCCTISVTLPEQMPEAQSSTIWHQQHLFISSTISGVRSGVINIYYPAKYKYIPASRSEQNLWWARTHCEHVIRLIFKLCISASPLFWLIVAAVRSPGL